MSWIHIHPAKAYENSSLFCKLNRFSEGSGIDMHEACVIVASKLRSLAFEVGNSFELQLFNQQ